MGLPEYQRWLHVNCESTIFIQNETTTSKMLHGIQTDQYNVKLEALWPILVYAIKFQSATCTVAYCNFATLSCDAVGPTWATKSHDKIASVTSTLQSNNQTGVTR